jgi:hypothetical protein
MIPSRRSLRHFVVTVYDHCHYLTRIFSSSFTLISRLISHLTDDTLFLPTLCKFPKMY